MTERSVHCGAHGQQGIALLCIHLASVQQEARHVGFFYGTETDLARPDGWCVACETRLLNGVNGEAWMREADFKIVCALCWDEVYGLVMGEQPTLP